MILFLFIDFIGLRDPPMRAFVVERVVNELDVRATDWRREENHV